MWTHAHVYVCTQRCARACVHAETRLMCIDVHSHGAVYMHVYACASTHTNTDRPLVHTCTYTSAGLPCPETRHNPAAPSRTSRGADAVMAILATFRAAQNLWEDTSGPHKSSGADTDNNKEKPGDPGRIDFLFCFAPRGGHLTGRAGRNYVLSPLQGASALTR